MFRDVHEPKGHKQLVETLQQVPQRFFFAAEKITTQLVTTMVDASVPFALVDNTELICLLKMLHPRYEVPSRHTAQPRTLSDYAKVKDKLREVIREQTALKVSVTVDGWSSRMFRSYVVITEHCVDKNWKLQTILLDFVRFPSPHDGESVKDLLECGLSQWNLLSKVTAVT